MQSASQISPIQIAILVGSARTNGNTMQIVDLLRQTLQNKVSVHDLKALNINGFDYDNSFKEDDFLSTLDDVLDADVVIFATPIYWYTLSSQLKQFVERLSDITLFYPDLLPRFRGKRGFLLMTGASDEVPEGMTVAIEKTCTHLQMKYTDSLYIQFEDQEPKSTQFMQQILQFASNILKQR